MSSHAGGHTSPDLIELARNVCRDVTVPKRAVERLAKAIRYEEPMVISVTSIGIGSDSST